MLSEPACWKNGVVRDELGATKMTHENALDASISREWESQPLLHI